MMNESSPHVGYSTQTLSAVALAVASSHGVFRSCEHGDVRDLHLRSLVAVGAATSYSSSPHTVIGAHSLSWFAPGALISYSPKESMLQQYTPTAFLIFPVRTESLFTTAACPKLDTPHLPSL